MVISRLKAKLAKQCEVELENRKLQQELRELKDGMARLLQQDTHLKDKLTAMTVGMKATQIRTLGSVESKQF